MNNRIGWLGLVVAVSLSLVAGLLWVVERASAEGPEAAWAGGPMSAGAGVISATLYFPSIYLSRPRPYVPPEDSVAVVNTGELCVGFSTHVTACVLAGDIMNTTATPVYGVTAGVDICDSTGAVIYTEQGQTLLPEIASGQLGSIRINFGESIILGQHWCGTRVISWSTQISNPILPITILSPTRSAIPCGSGLEIAQVQGALRNETAQSVSPTVATASLYDASGFILNNAVYTAEATLDPGMLAPFTITFDAWPGCFGYGRPIAYFTVEAQGVEAP